MDNLKSLTGAWAQSVLDQSADWPDPQSLQAPDGVPTEFPLEAMADLQPVIEALQVATQAPVGLVAASVLSVANFAAFAIADVSLWGGVPRPISLMILTEGVSGERKSTVDALATIGVDQFQQEQLASWRVLKDMYAAGETETDPGPPPFVKLTEATLQGIEAGFVQGPAAQYLATDEAGRFLGGYSMKMENRIASISALSQHWDGRTLTKRLRGAGNQIGETTHLHGCRLGVHLLGQKEVLQPFLSDPVARGQGILARFLLHAPGSTIGTRHVTPEHFNTPAVSHAVSGFADRVCAMLKRAPDRDLTSMQVERLVLKLTDEAVDELVDFGNQVEFDMRPGGELAQVRNFVNKAPEQAGRIGATMAVMAGQDRVEASSMRSGIAIASYFLNETRRLASRAEEDPLVEKAEKLVQWLSGPQRNGCRISEVLRLGPSCVRQKRVRDDVLEFLQNKDWIRAEHERIFLNPKARL